MDKPKNVTLLFNGDNLKAQIERGVKTHERRQLLDFPVSGYQISFAMTGGYVVTVSYEGSDLKDFLTFPNKEALIDALDLVLK